MQFRVNIKQRGDTFGEVSLMYNVPRSATVAATKESLVWVLERDTFRSALAAISHLLLPSSALLHSQICCKQSCRNMHAGCQSDVQIVISA